MRGSLPHRARAYIAFLRTFGDVFWQRIRFAAFVAFFVIEGGLALLAILWSSRATYFAKSADTGRIFNPDGVSAHLRGSCVSRTQLHPSLAVDAFAGRRQHVCAGPWGLPGPARAADRDGRMRDAGCHWCTNAFQPLHCSGGPGAGRRHGACSRGRRTMRRQDIRGVREYQRGKGPRLIELVSWHPEAAPLRLPPVTYEDGHFRVLVRFPAATCAVGSQ